MSWLYNNSELLSIPDKAIGFVYLITNLKTNQKYVGKKNFYFTAYKQVNKKKKRIKKESDWKTYHGSSNWLNDDIEKLGIENFKREILRICSKKGELSYFEASYQFKWDVLTAKLPNGDRAFYNDQIRVRVHSSHLKGIDI